MKVRVERLEQLLRMWEDVCFLLHLIGLGDQKLGLNLKYPIAVVGQLLYWQDLRNDILHDHVSEEKYHAKELSELFASKATYPFELTKWTHSSRRVFDISQELSVLLSLTSLENLTWGDIKWPFGGFAITLAEPIIGESGKAYDAILVSKLRDSSDLREIMIIRLFSTELDQYRPLSQYEKSEMTALYRKGNYIKAVKKASARVPDYFEPDSFVGIPLDRIGDVLVTESHDHLLQFAGYKKIKPADGSAQAIRIALGLCVYLSTLPTKTSHKSEWQGHRSPSERKTITDGAEICTVTSIFRLTTEEKEILHRMKDRPTVELGAHFRIGHWRRPPGQGQNPEALKTVWVRPTLVRKDKLVEGEVVGGAITKL